MFVGKLREAEWVILLLLLTGSVAAGCSNRPGARRAHAAPLPPIEMPVTGAAPHTADSILQAHLREAVARLGDPREPRGPVLTLVGILNTGADEPPAKVRVSAGSDTSRQPPEVVRDTVPAGFAPIRRCYVQVLATSPELSARVETRFVVGRDGKVTGATSTSTEMPPAALACIEKAFRELRFPAPESGIVKVNYPIVFAPGAPATPARPAEAPRHHAPPPAGPWPIITVEGTTVRLDGAVVAEAPATGAEPGRKVLEPLRDALVAERTKWMAAHPGARFPAVVGVRVAPELPLRVFRAVFQSAARAGFQRLFLQSASDPDVVAPLLVHVPGVEIEGEVAETLVAEPRLVASVAGGELVLRWHTFTRTVAEDRAPFAAADVAPRLCASWKEHGVHRAPDDRQRDHLVLELVGTGTAADLETFTQAAGSCLRPRRAADGTTRPMPAYWVSVRGD